MSKELPGTAVMNSVTIVVDGKAVHHDNYMVQDNIEIQFNSSTVYSKAYRPGETFTFMLSPELEQVSVPFNKLKKARKKIRQAEDLINDCVEDGKEQLAESDNDGV